MRSHAEARMDKAVSLIVERIVKQLMAIVKMKKLRLLAIKSQRDEILRQLLLAGCVEVTEPEKEELRHNA